MRTLLIAATPGVREKLAAVDGQALSEMAAAEAESEFDALVVASVDVIVLGDAMPIEEALVLAERIAAASPEVGQVLVSEPDAEVLEYAGRLGIRDVVSPGAAHPEFAAALFSAKGDQPPLTVSETDLVTDMPDETPDLAERPYGLEPASEPETVEEAIAQGEDGRAVVIASPKGGVGKSTIAANIALALAKQAPKQVVLVDLDAQFGDIATLLDLSTPHSVVDAIGALGTADTVLLKSYLVTHKSGLVILAAPDSPTAADRISADQARALIEHLKVLFPIVVADTAPGFTEQGIGALEAADDLVMVVTPDVAVMRGVLREIDVLDSLGVTENRHMVINMTDRRSGLAAVDVEKFMETKAALVLPRELDVVLAGNKGEPLVLEKKAGEVAKRITEFAESLVGVKRSVVKRSGAGRRERKKEKS